MRRSRIGSRRARALLAGIVVAGALAPAIGSVTPAAAAVGVTEYPVPTAAADLEGIVTGADSNLWFTESAGNKIAKISPAGAITEYVVPTAGAGPQTITAGPDGNLWFTEYLAGNIAKVAPATGTITEYPVGDPSFGPFGITTGPDGNLWFTETNAKQIGKITPAGVVTEYDVSSAQCASPYHIAAGPDGKLWYTAIGCGFFGGVVNTITTAGVPGTPQFIGSRADPFGITAGPDGAMWFTENGRSKIGRLTTANVLTEYTIPGDSAPQQIAVGPDGNLWLGEYSTGRVGRITPTGDLSEFAVPAGSQPVAVGAGPVADGRIWFTEIGTNNIGAIDPAAAVPLPAVFGLDPVSGPYTGGTSVTIRGVSFTGATAVTFGSTAATSFSVDSDSQITASAPALAGAYYDVLVTTPAGTTAAVPTDRYASLTPLKITSLTPSEGDPDGNTSVTVLGSGFASASKVTFGGVQVDASVNSDTQITAKSPAFDDHSVVNVAVTTLGGTSPIVTADLFTYLARPVVTTLSPANGPAAGGTTVTLMGQRFTGATSVSFGDATVACPARCTVVSDEQIVVLAPPHATDAVTVVVNTPGDGSSVPGPIFAYTGVGAFTPVGLCAECAYFGLATLPSGKVLGLSRDGGVQAHLFDPKTATWSDGARCDACALNGTFSAAFTVIPPTPASACGTRCGMALFLDGTSAYLYDPGHDTWTPTGDATAGPLATSLVVLNNSKILTYGGDAGSVYDPLTGTWTATGPLPRNYGSDTATLLQNGKVLVVSGGGAGLSARPPRILNASLYDPASNTWADTGSPLQGRLAHQAMRLNDGRVLVTGGTVNFYQAVRTAELYDQATGAFTPAPSTVFARNSHAGVVLPDGRAVLFGGDEPFASCGCDAASGNAPSVAEVLDTARTKWLPTSPSGVALQDRGQNNQQYTARVAVLPQGPASTCGSACGQVLMVRGNDVGSLDIPLTPSGALYAPAPQVAASSPATGSVDGGTPVTITGNSLASVTSVTFGGVPAISVTPDATSPDTKVVVVAPAHSAGAVDIGITTAGGAVVAGKFTFVAAPPPAPPPSDGSTSGGGITTSGGGVVTIVPTGPGYALATAVGGVYTFGTAPFVGSVGGHPLNQPVVAIEHTPSGNGYWLASADGGVFAFGDARYFGSTGGIHLAKPIVAMRSTPAGDGYWLIASDGGVFAFGAARFFGSTGAVHLNSPVVAADRSASGRGYWLAAADGGVFAFGDAPYRGSTGAIHLTRPVVSLARSLGGNGYWMAASDGGVFAFGDAPFAGSAGATTMHSPVVGLAPAPAGAGYWLCARDGSLFAFGTAEFRGSLGDARPAEPVVGCSAKRSAGPGS